MPYKMKKTKGGKFSVSGPSGIHAKGTTREKAESQMRLLRGIEHGMVPRKLRDRSTKGSPPFTDAELMQGYRKLGG